MTGTPTQPDGDAERSRLRQISEDIAAAYSLVGLNRASTRLVLLDVDPCRVHAYWRIEHNALFRVRVAAADPSPRLVLRVRTLVRSPANRAPPQDFPVRTLTGSLYIDLPSGGAGCYAEIGLQCHGRFHPLAVSNLVRPPPGQASSRYELIPVDTRIDAQVPPADPRCGEAMDGPLPLPAADEGSWPGNSPASGSSPGSRPDA